MPTSSFKAVVEKVGTLVRIGVIASVGHHLESFWESLGEAMSDSGNELFFAAGDFSTMPNFTLIRGVTRRPSLYNVLAPRYIREWADEKRLDLIVTNTATVSFIVRQAKVRVPVVYFAHGLHWVRETGPEFLLWSSVEKASLRNTDGAIVLNREDEEWFSRMAPKLPLLRLSFGVGLPTHQFPRSEVPTDYRAIWIGEFSKRKRPDIAIRAAADLATRLPGFRLSMLGRGKLLDSSKKLAADLGLGDRVSFPGHVDPAPYLQEAAVLVHTASWEGLPRVVLEAMAVGRPVIAMNAKGVRELEGVRLVAGEDPGALAATIYCHFKDQNSSPSRVSAGDLDSKVAAKKIVEFLDIVRGEKSKS